MNLKLILAISLISLLSFLMQWWQADFLYVRESISHGEGWRILTGQLVHTNWTHFALNISSLILFALLFYNTIHVKNFTISLFLIMLCVGICIHLLEPKIHWYAGLSGAIYGLYLVGAYYTFLANDRLMGTGIAILIIGKVLFDHWFGPIYNNDELIGARVVTESHLYGISAAIILCGLNTLYRSCKPATPNGSSD